MHDEWKDAAEQLKIAITDYKYEENQSASSRKIPSNFLQLICCIERYLTLFKILS